MTVFRSMLARGAGLGIGLGALALVACGGQEPPAGPVDSVVEPTPVPAAATDVPQATAATATTATAEPVVSVPDPTEAPTSVPAVAPTATSVPTPEPAPVSALTAYDQYGFSLKIDRDTEIRAAGWNQAEANEQQGVLSFPYGGVTVLLRWVPVEGLAPADILSDGMEIGELTGLESGSLGGLMAGLDGAHIEEMGSERQEAVLEALEADFLGVGAADFGSLVAEGAVSFGQAGGASGLSALNEEVQQFAGLDLFGGDLFGGGLFESGDTTAATP